MQQPPNNPTLEHQLWSIQQAFMLLEPALKDLADKGDFNLDTAKNILSGLDAAARQVYSIQQQLEAKAAHDAALEAQRKAAAAQQPGFNAQQWG